MSVLSNRN